MKTISSNREMTLYLRGVAIVIVLVNHYVNYYLSDQFGGYAYRLVSFFFVLSGFGIYHSLDNVIRQGTMNAAQLVYYFYKRFIRILPLYWLSLLGASYLFPNQYPLSEFVIFPLFRSHGVIYWFVTAILQCYLVGPLLFLFLKRFGKAKYIICLSFLMLLSFIYPLMHFDLSCIHFVYGNFLLGHIYLFGLGMLIPSLVSENKDTYADKTLTLSLLLVFVMLVFHLHGIKRADVLTYRTANFLAPFFIISAFGFCLFFIATKPRLPFKKIILLLGTYSYSLYLLHYLFYKSLYNIEIIKKASVQGTVTTIVLFPIFLSICVLIEKGLNYSTRQLWRISEKKQ